MKTINLATLYDSPLFEWDAVRTRLAAGLNQAPGSQEGAPGRHTTWVTTLNDDGSPHVNAVGSIWVDDHFYIVTGPHTRRGRNLLRDPRCTLSVSVREFDLTVEGTAVRVTGDELVRIARQYHDHEGWPAEPTPDTTALDAPFSAQSAGPAPWHLHRLDADSAHAVQCVEPHGASRWYF